MKTLIININTFCKNSCIMCHVKDYYNKNIFIDVKIINRIINEADKLNIKNLFIAGGEPLLHPQITDILKIAHHSKINTILFTAGIKDINIINQIVKYPPNKITLSIDSPIKNIHNYIRGNKNSFDEIIIFYKYLKGSKKDIDFNSLTVLCKTNSKTLYLLPDFMEILGINNYGVTLPIRDFMYKNLTLEYSLLAYFYFRILPTIIRKAKNYRHRFRMYPIFYQLIDKIDDYDYLLDKLTDQNLKIFKEELHNFSLGQYNVIKDRYYPCKLFGNDILIDSNLNIFPCSQMTIINSKNKIGNFKKVNLTRALKNIKKRNFDSCKYCISFSNEL